ncbi:MAG: hypothetical protein J0M13_04090 [Candidatus Accumulibacter sp.]|nr:hypothetical protein [Candidatus Accumulibacter necessarius]
MTDATEDGLVGLIDRTDAGNRAAPAVDTFSISGHVEHPTSFSGASSLSTDAAPCP